MKNLLVVLLFSSLFITCKEPVKKEYVYDNSLEIRDPEFVSLNNKKKIRSTAEAIAIANGLNNWSKVREINFTFNLDQDSTHYERSWSWKPKTNMVTMTSTKDTITYKHTDINTTSIKADHGFVNDKYWLLAPFNLVWDEASFTSKHHLKAMAPISKTKMQKLTILYKDKGGYTPGDAYDFYFNGDFKIKEWAFRKGNISEPSLITSWEDHENFDGINIAKTHRKNEGDWKLYFTNITIVTD